MNSKYLPLLFLILFAFGNRLLGQKINYQDYPKLVAKIDSLNDVPVDYVLTHIEASDTIYTQNWNVAKTINYVYGEAESLNRLRLIKAYKGEIDIASDYMFQAIEKYDSLGMDSKVGYLYTELGYGKKRNDLPEAKRLMKLGISMMDETKDSSDISSAYNNIGVVYAMNEQLDSALYFYKKGLAYKRALKDSISIPYSLNNLSGLYVMMDSMEKVPPLMEEAIELRKKANNLNGLGESYSSYASYFFYIENLEKAIEYFQLSNEVAKEINYKNLMQHNYLQLSGVYEMQENHKESLAQFKLHQLYKDSILNEDNLNKIAELEVEFETERREKELAEQKQLNLQQTLDVRNRTIIALVLFGALIVLAILWYYYNKQQQLDRALEQAAYENEMIAEKNRISRDLHDNIGSQVTFLISSLDNMKYKNEIDTAAIDDLNTSAKQTLSQLRTTVWAIKSKEITLEAFADRLQDFVRQAEIAAPHLTYHLTVEGEQQYKLSATQSINLFRIVQESVQNAVKYANCSVIELQFSATNHQLKALIKDNGQGFDVANTARGNGLYFMQQRMEEINGTMNIHSGTEGTSITLQLVK